MTPSWSSPLLEDPTVLVVPAGSPLVDSDHVRLSDLAEQEWIIRAGNHPVAGVLRRACRQAGFAPRIAYASHDYQEAQAMVAAGIGLALAPRLALTNRRSDVRLLSLARERGSDFAPPVRRILLAAPAQRAATPAAQAMARVLHAVARGFTDPGLDRPQLEAVRKR
ncbi:LysR substrate-binding domain-containing protein [Streptomyces sp. SudanB182_2057]|uniref:LysR substrate-binding domain-containing protein n=1 Tax=Streptomyces sp. SudanB182_2057 TaxID=3035281 RepID=UPI003F561301